MSTRPPTPDDEPELEVSDLNAFDLDTSDLDAPDLNDSSVVELPFEDVLDLHGFPPRDVREIVLGYLDGAVAAGFGAVRIVHGKGIGVQREAVRALLAAHARVVEYGDAPEHQGGKGATVALLRVVEPTD